MNIPMVQYSGHVGFPKYSGVRKIFVIAAPLVARFHRSRSIFSEL